MAKNIKFLQSSIYKAIDCRYDVFIDAIITKMLPDMDRIKVC